MDQQQEVVPNEESALRAPNLESSYRKLARCLSWITPQDEEPVWRAATYGQDVVFPSLAECAFVLAFNWYASTHLASGFSWYEIPMFYAVIYLVNNILSRFIMASSFLKSRFPVDGDDRNDQYSLLVQGSRIQRAMMFVFADVARNLSTHEAGHMSAASFLYQNATPQLQIEGGILVPRGSFTNFSGNWTLSPLGERLGANESRVVLSAMGPGTDILSTIFSLIGAQFASRRFPEVSLFLRMSALFTILMDVMRAIDAYSSHHMSDNTCDYRDGLSPKLMIGLLIGLPFMVQLVLSMASCCMNRQNPDEDARDNVSIQYGT